MEEYLVKIVGTSIVVILTIILHILINASIQKIRKKYGFKEGRAKTLTKLLNVTLNFITLMIILSIWGVDQKKIAIFVSSFVAVLGVALVAQWSILSNITASIILFINHPARIDDEITFLDKDLPLTGIIRDIGAFFIIIETEENETISIPNNLIFQKTIKITSKEAQN